MRFYTQTIDLFCQNGKVETLTIGQYVQAAEPNGNMPTPTEREYDSLFLQ